MDEHAIPAHRITVEIIDLHIIHEPLERALLESLHGHKSAVSKQNFVAHSQVATIYPPSVHRCVVGNRRKVLRARPRCQVLTAHHPVWVLIRGLSRFTSDCDEYQSAVIGNGIRFSNSAEPPLILDDIERPDLIALLDCLDLLEALPRSHKRPSRETAEGPRWSIASTRIPYRRAHSKQVKSYPQASIRHSPSAEILSVVACSQRYSLLEFDN
jgi:hypothetical protein